MNHLRWGVFARQFTHQSCWYVVRESSPRAAGRHSTDVSLLHPRHLLVMTQTFGGSGWKILRKSIFTPVVENSNGDEFRGRGLLPVLAPNIPG